MPEVVPEVGLGAVEPEVGAVELVDSLLGSAAALAVPAAALAVPAAALAVPAADFLPDFAVALAVAVAGFLLVTRWIVAVWHCFLEC